ncbi:MAG: toxin [Legionellaceae bacterium]|nr:toxin [Legionellaceae bacterium]
MKLKKLQYDFSPEKNQVLIEERGVCFEDIVSALHHGHLLDVIAHPNESKYPNQKIYIVNLSGYVYLVPFVVKDKQTIFLKTIFPSRKLTKKYLVHGGV